MHNYHTILKKLDELGIVFNCIQHKPVFTCEQADELDINIDGTFCKNLFLKDKYKRKILLVISSDVPVNLKELAEKINSSRLSFCSPDELFNCLGVTPGSVTPLAIINDVLGQVDLFFDSNVANSEFINCHPLTNAATVSISFQDLKKFIQHTNHKFCVLDLEN